MAWRLLQWMELYNAKLTTTTVTTTVQVLLTQLPPPPLSICFQTQVTFRKNIFQKRRQPEKPSERECEWETQRGPKHINSQRQIVSRIKARNVTYYSHINFTMSLPTQIYLVTLASWITLDFTAGPASALCNATAVLLLGSSVIIITFLFMFAFPVLLCLFPFDHINILEPKVSTYKTFTFNMTASKHFFLNTNFPMHCSFLCALLSHCYTCQYVYLVFAINSHLRFNRSNDSHVSLAFPLSCVLWQQ